MISVCLPYWNRPGELARLFGNLRDVYPSEQLEVCVADDGSDPPAALPQPLPAGMSAKIVQVRPPGPPLNPCVPINRAVEVSTGDLIALTGAEIQHHCPTLLEMRALIRDPLDYVTAPCHDPERGWLAGPEVDYRGGGRLPVPEGAHFHFLALFTRTLWEKAGGFDEEYRHGQACDDNDWLWRLARAGARFRCARTFVTHRPGPRVPWGLPHNRDLFYCKWPATTS